MNNIIFWTGIWPKWYSRPIGVYQLSYWLRKNGVESQIIDFCQWHSADDLVSLTEHFISKQTRFIGISTAFWSDNSVPNNILDAITEIKKRYPDIQFVFGGPRADNDMIRSLGITIVGEGENKLLHLIKGHNLSPLFDITTLEHRFSEKDCIVEGEVLPIELGRGCIFKCKFCGHHNLGKSKYTYQRSINLIEDEIIYNYENFKTTHYHFLDDTVNEDPVKIKNLSKIPNSTGIDLKWNGYLRLDLISRYPETADQLIESGMSSCFFGIETFHPDASMKIGKGWNGKHAKDFLIKLHNELWDNKVNIWANFIVGLPGESQAYLNETVNWCLENPIGHYQFAPLSLYAHRTDSGSVSEFNRNYKDYGYELDSNSSWYNNYMTQADAANLAEEFNKRLSPNNKLSSWSLFDAVNCGVTLDKGMKYPHNIRLFSIFINKILIPYKNKLRQL